MFACFPSSSQGSAPKPGRRHKSSLLTPFCSEAAYG